MQVIPSEVSKTSRL